MINLLETIPNNRLTRVVIGKYSTFDISEIFETNERDFLDGEPITHENFDDDDIFYIRNFGYCKRRSLVECGYSAILCDDLYSDITEDNLI